MASSTDYRAAFLSRTKAARVNAGFTQEQIARALDMPQDKYKTYEVRSLLPHSLIERFCLITRVDPLWLLTGSGQAVQRKIHSVSTPKRPRRAAS
jgi:hypothetical protein